MPKDAGQGLALSRDARPAREPTTRVVESAVAIAILVVGMLVVYDSVRLGARWTDDGPQAGYFPFYIGAILCICAAANLILVNVSRRPEAPVFVTHTALRRVLRVLGPAVVYVLAIQLFGLYVASAVYIAFFMVWLGGYRLALAAPIGIGLMAAFFLMFEVWFKVPLYKGMWDPLAFLGY